MKIIVLVSLYIVMIFAISVFLGCSGSPLDVVLDQSEKHSTDIVSEVSACYTGLRVEAEDGEYLAVFEKACVDAVLGFVESTDEVTVADIVSDTVVGGSAFEGQILRLTGTVTEILSSGETLLLETGNESVTFFVRSWGTGERVASYEVDTQYTFNLYIQDQALAFQQTDTFNVWADLVEDSEPVPITIDTLISDAKAENQRYAQRVITLRATVSNVLDSTIYLKEADLVTSVYIRRSGHTDEATYQVNQTYDFTVFVFKIGEWSVLDDRYEVRLGLVRTN